MKVMKKALSVFLAVLMMASAFSVGLYAFAADARLESLYAQLGYSFFEYDMLSDGVYDTKREVKKDENGYPSRSIVGDLDYYQVSNSSGDYVYSNEEDDSPIRSMSYTHAVNAKDNKSGSIKAALTDYLSIADELISTVYGEGYYTVPSMNDAVKKAVKFIKDDDGNYLFLDGYTYLVNNIGEIVGRSAESTYSVAGGAIKENAAPLTEIKWNVTGAIGDSAPSDLIESGALSALKLYEYCNVETIIDYFSGNCVHLNSGNWFHKFVFQCDTDLETVLVNDGGLSAIDRTNGLTMRHTTVTWTFKRGFDESGTKAYYYNGGYTIEENTTENTDCIKLIALQAKLDGYFSKYYADDVLESYKTDDLKREYDSSELKTDLETFNSLSDSAKVAAFGQSAYSFMNLVAQLKPIVENDTEATGEKYLPERGYENYEDKSYKVTTEKVSTVVSNIDKLLEEPKVVDIIKQFIDFDDPKYSDKPFYEADPKNAHDLIVQVIQNYLFSDDTINKIIGAIYPMVSKLIDQNITNDFIHSAIQGIENIPIDVLKDLLEEALGTIVEKNNGWQAVIYQVLLQGGYIALTPAGFAWVMLRAGYHTKYPEAYAEFKKAKGGTLSKGTNNGDSIEFIDENGQPLMAVGKEGDEYSENRWKDVNYDNVVWGVNGERQKFEDALNCALAPLAQLLAAVLGHAKLDVYLGDFAVDFYLQISDLDLYDDVLYPLLEAIGVTGLCAPGDFRKYAGNVMGDFNISSIKTFLDDGVIDPLLDWITGTLLEEPISVITTMLPNLSYYLTSGAFLATIKNINIPLKLRIDFLSVFDATPTIYTLEINKLLGDRIDFLDSLQGIIELIGLNVDTGIPLVGYKDPNDSSGAVFRPGDPEYDFATMTEGVKVAYRNSSGNLLDHQTDEYNIEVKGTDENGAIILENVAKKFAAYVDTAGNVVSTDVSDDPKAAPTGTDPVYEYYEWETVDEATGEKTLHRNKANNSGDPNLEPVRNIPTYRESIHLPAIMDYKLQSCGKLETNVSTLREGRIDMTAKDGTITFWDAYSRNRIVMEDADNKNTEGLVLIFLLRYVFSALQYRVYDGGSFTSDYTLLDVFGVNTRDTLNKEIFNGFKLMDIINNVNLHPDEAIAALFEILYPEENGSLLKMNEAGDEPVKGDDYKFGLDYVNYHVNEIWGEAASHRDYNYGTALLYTKYWSKEDARYVVNHIDEIIDDVLAMLKITNFDSLSGTLDDLLTQYVFNNDTLSNLVGKVYGALDNIKMENFENFKISEVLNTLLDVDYSKNALKSALEYEFRDVDGYNSIGDVHKNDVWLKLHTDVTAGSDPNYDEYYFYDTSGTERKALDWGFDNSKISSKYTPAEIFLRAASAAFSPFAILAKFLFAGEDLNILDLIHISGYESYFYSWIPLMETFMADEGLSSYETYFNQVYGKSAHNGYVDAELKTAQNCDAFYYLLQPLVRFAEDVVKDPLGELLNVLPNVAFFMSIGGLNGVINNFAHFAYVLLDIISPIYDAYPLVNSLLSNLRISENVVLNLSLPLDMDINELVSSIIEGVLGDTLTFSVENKSIQVGGTKENPRYATGVLKISIPYIDLSTLCVGRLARKVSISGNEILVLNSSGGADLMTLLLRLVSEVVFYRDNAFNIANFLIGYCQLDDEYDNDDLLLEIFEFLNTKAHENEIPDKLLGWIFDVYKALAPVADDLGGRFKYVGFSITEMLENMDNLDYYMDQLLNAGGSRNPNVSGWARLLKLVRDFFKKVLTFLRKFFGITK